VQSLTVAFLLAWFDSEYRHHIPYNPTLHADYPASDCSFSALDIAGMMTVDPADMNFGDKRVAAVVLGLSIRRNAKSATPYAQHNQPNIM